MGERRQVTVLFADLSGFTKLSQQLDAEDTHALLNRFFAVADAAIEEYGGHIDKHIGDNVMAVFGAPTAHSNDPERAVRAALDIHTAVAKLDPPLGVHIGLAAGTVVASGTGSDAHQEYTVTGETVNLAARLQDAAQRGETLIADDIHREVSSLFRCESAAGMNLKGIDGSVRAWHVLAALDSASQGHSRPFVGRQREIRRFASILDACAETRDGECVYLRGEVGVGKTYAMIACVNSGETSGIRQYADALEAYFLAEPLRTSDYFIRWGRTLAAFGDGDKGDNTLADLRQLRQQAEDFNIAMAVSALDAALGDTPVRSHLGRAD